MYFLGLGCLRNHVPRRYPGKNAAVFADLEIRLAVGSSNRKSAFHVTERFEIPSTKRLQPVPEASRNGLYPFESI